jgi:hypothetical protein
MGAGFRHQKRSEARFILPEVLNGEQETASLKEKNGRMHNFCSFLPNQVL